MVFKQPCIKSRHSREACPVLDTGTGIQKDIAKHGFWIPTYVGMTKRLKNNTYDTKPIQAEGEGTDCLPLPVSLTKEKASSASNVSPAQKMKGSPAWTFARLFPTGGAKV
jgi:hypothetical protein